MRIAIRRMTADGLRCLRRHPDARPRIPSDINHAAARPFPVPYKVVRSAIAERVTTATARPDCSTLSLRQGAELVQDGADGITTSCGFLSIYQRELATHCSVSVRAIHRCEVGSLRQYTASNGWVVDALRPVHEVHPVSV
jgi:hypothetical protein